MQSLVVFGLMAIFNRATADTKLHKIRANCLSVKLQDVYFASGWDIFILFNAVRKKSPSFTNDYLPQRWFNFYVSVEVRLVKLLYITIMLILETLVSIECRFGPNWNPNLIMRFFYVYNKEQRSSKKCLWKSHQKLYYRDQFSFASVCVCVVWC